MLNLFKNEQDCCGCTACFQACPTSAIALKENEKGFIYPIINSDLCINCGKCEKVCAFQNITETNKPIKSFVAANKSDDILNSTSGGVFVSIAKAVIARGGVVFGASMEYENNKLKVSHIAVENEGELIKLQGSKYTQSDTSSVFKNVKTALSGDRLTLFSGTPCQVAGLKAFLGNKEYKNLILLDLICHGIPSAKFFGDYISLLEEKLNGRIFDYKFRDKKKGWAYVSKVSYFDKNNSSKSKHIYGAESSYIDLFLKSYTFRDSCYNCKYASSSRPGDITIGDYWGIENEHSDYLSANGGKFNELKGISCAIVNTEKGAEILSGFGGELLLADSTFEKIAKKNGQLRHPCKKSPVREKIFEIYQNEGYKAVDRYFYKSLGAKYYIKFFINRLPSKVKKFARRVIK